MTITIHQALHGYSEGHRQLACSASLDPKDARQLLVMSDVAGPGVASVGLPYLTGYPLADSSVYALSMTWPALEMPRPGCVWTHTLLVSFTDLAVMDVPSALTSLFRRPNSQQLDEYNRGLAVDLGSPYREQLDADGAQCLALYASALYGHPYEQVWARRPSGVDVDDVVLRLWDQQWPRLRRSFKFCTLTSRDRSQGALLFDLQLTLGSNSSSRLRMASNQDGFEAAEVDKTLWVADLVHDAILPGRSSLRQMLRRLGADMLGGREAMSAICTLHAVLEVGTSKALELAVEFATKMSPLSSSDMAKGMVLKALLESMQPLDSKHVLDFVLEQYQFLTPSEADEHSQGLARIVWDTDPRTFVLTAYDGTEPVTLALKRGASGITIDAVLGALPMLKDLAEPLLQVFPKLAQETRFWAETQSWPSSVAALGVDISGHSALCAMVSGLREEGAINSTLHVAGTIAVLACLDGLLRESAPVPQLDGWIRQACADVHGVAGFLSQSSSHSPEFLRQLSSCLSPDAVPNDYGDDPWFLALNSLRASEAILPVELAAYGFRRALGWRSRSVEPLLQLTFEPLHEASLKDEIPPKSWGLLEASLPWVSSNESWNNGLKLRRAVAKKCVDLPVSAQGFFHLVKSEELFVNLLEAVWHLWSGGRYLRAVRDDLEDVGDRSLARRRRVFKAFLKDHSYW